MKELIEKLEDKIKNTPTNTSENRRIRGVYTDCLIMVKQALQQRESEWISVEDRLPEEFKSVLVCGDDIRSVALYKDAIFYVDFSVLHHSKVTHWMPLPTPPNK